MEKVNVLKQLEKFRNGEYNSRDRDTQISAGWFDWFCKDTSLVNKTKALYRKVASVLDANETGKRFDPEKVYVFFKNNCPVSGNLYDSFSFVDIETGDVVFWITPASGHKVDRMRAQVAGPENGFEKNLVEGCWNDVLDYFSTPKE